MDNLCHSLVGAVMSAGGLRRRTGLATVTMVIGANLPDVDAVVYLTSDSSTGLAFRRGWTHGVLAMLVLPVLLTAIMVIVGRAVERARSGRPRKALPMPIRPLQLLLVSALAVWTHPLFDMLNTYGVRLLMPFSGRWFYGDALFIIDPWVWAVLALGTAVSLRRARTVPVGAGTATVMRRAERPARIAMAAVGTYVVVMLATSTAGRVLVEREATSRGNPPASHVMVGPQPLTPLRRSVVRELPGHYEMGELTWFPLRYRVSATAIPTGLETATVRSAARAPAAQRFFVWSRFPYAETATQPGAVSVRFDDARYGGPGVRSFASVTVTLADSITEPR